MLKALRFIDIDFWSSFSHWVVFLSLSLSLYLSLEWKLWNICTFKIKFLSCRQIKSTFHMIMVVDCQVILKFELLFLINFDNFVFLPFEKHENVWDWVTFKLIWLIHINWIKIIEGYAGLQNINIEYLVQDFPLVSFTINRLNATSNSIQIPFNFEIPCRIILLIAYTYIPWI